MRPLRFTVIGITGYSSVHLKAIDWLKKAGLATLSGVIVSPAEHKIKPDLVKYFFDHNISIYKSIDHFFEQGTHGGDILTVATGIHQHVPVCIRAMETGLHVYCEKPIGATVSEVDELIRTKEKTGKKILIGFQHIYSNSVLQLKKRICDGRLGKVGSISIMCGWPRSKQYYERNQWAGKLKLKNSWVLDSPANNAHGHFLFNMLYLSSSEPGKSAIPTELKAELYRANFIKSSDLVQLKFKTDYDTDCFIILAHCNWKELGPVMKIKCEKGDVLWKTEDGVTKISYHNRQIEKFDNLTQKNWRYHGFKDLVNAIKTNREPLSTPQFARSHTLTINAMHKSCPDILQIDEDYVSETVDSEMFPPGTPGNFRKVIDLDTIIKKAFAETVFLSELQIPWTKKIRSKPITVQQYFK